VSEKDDRVKGEGNSYTTFFRQLDPRLGRWLSIVQALTIPYKSSTNNNTIPPIDSYLGGYFSENKDGTTESP